jgi:hypothetical protein
VISAQRSQRFRKGLDGQGVSDSPFVPRDLTGALRAPKEICVRVPGEREPQSRRDRRVSFAAMKTLSKHSIALSTIAAILAAPASAQICSTMCSRYEEGECVEYEHTCVSEPSPPRPSFGAIAYGKASDAFGFSFGWNSQAKAESVALRNCAQHGSDCEVMVWFDRRCGAVAARGDHKCVYWGLGNSARAAQNVALTQCTKDHGPTCAVKVSQCSW